MLAEENNPPTTTVAAVAKVNLRIIAPVCSHFEVGSSDRMG